MRALQVQLQNVEIIAVGMQGSDLQRARSGAVVLVIIVGTDVGNAIRAEQCRASPRVIVVLPAALSPTMPSTIGLLFSHHSSSRGILCPRALVRYLRVPRPSLLGTPGFGECHRRDAKQLLFGMQPPSLTKPAGLAQFHAVNGIAHTASIGKLRLFHPQLEILEKRLARFGVKGIVLLAQHQFGNGRSTPPASNRES